MVLLDEAEEYQQHHNYDGYDDTPHQALVTTLFSHHFLLELIVCLFYVVVRADHLLVDEVNFGALELSLVLDIVCYIVDVTHDFLYTRDCLVATFD